MHFRLKTKTKTKSKIAAKINTAADTGSSPGGVTTLSLRYRAPKPEVFTEPQNLNLTGREREPNTEAQRDHQT